MVCSGVLGQYDMYDVVVRHDVVVFGYSLVLQQNKKRRDPGEKMSPLISL